VLHTKPRPIGLQVGSSYPWACSSAPPGPLSPKFPPFKPTWSPPNQTPKAWQTSDPQTFTISTGPCPSGLHRPAWSPLHQVVPLRPAQACEISALLGHALQACQARDPQTFTISTKLYDQASHACTGLHDPPRDYAPKACQLGKDTHDLHSTSPCTSGTQGPHSKSSLVHLNKSPLPVGLWIPTQLPPTTGELQTCLRDTHRWAWMLKE
jgi:hypothetical protein